MLSTGVKTTVVKAWVKKQCVVNDLDDSQTEALLV